MAANMTLPTHLPPLPSYHLEPMTALVSGIPDKYLSVILPVIAYWSFSMLFHLIDTYDLFPQYRLHTPAEILKRNHATRWEVIRDVLSQHVLQTLAGFAFAYFDADQMTGKEEYDVAVWSQRLRRAQAAVPTLLSLVGLDAQRLAKKTLTQAPTLAGFLSGGKYPWLFSISSTGPVSHFVAWELFAAKAIYWILVPALQFAVAVAFLDTWQYFLHRAMHSNKYLYTTFHARHHRLYVPYAYGALYNHPAEGFTLDTLGSCIAYLVAGLTPRQCMWFFVVSTIKTVDDHCGYALPWDPLQHITRNNAGYHDVHHQSWGIKTNFSQPFFTFWDRLLGTVWTGGDVSARYERAKLAAQKKVHGDKPVTDSKPIDSVLEPAEPYYSTKPDRRSSKVLSNASRPYPPAGKAASQALNSREQVLDAPLNEGGGPKILAEETAEEDKESKRLTATSTHSVRRSPRKMASVSGSGTPGSSFQSLRNRVRAGSFHGPTGGVLGYEGGS